MSLYLVLTLFFTTVFSNHRDGDRNRDRDNNNNDNLINNNPNILSIITDEDIESLEEDIIARINSFKRPDTEIDELPLIGTLVRLGFHDCGGTDYFDNAKSGICNGCINPNDDDHFGLEYGVIYPIEQVFQNQNQLTVKRGSETVVYTDPSTPNWSNPSGIKWSERMNRADFWSSVGTVAIEYSVELAWEHTSDLDALGEPRPHSWGDALRNGDSIRYWFGRDTIGCDGDSPFNLGFEDGDDRFFASPFWGHNDLFNFFKEKFDFNEKESVTIMGAHSIGRGHGHIDVNNLESSQNDDTKCCGGSGFKGSWKTNPHLMDNGYFSQLISIGQTGPAMWEQVAPCWDGIECHNGFLTSLEGRHWKNKVINEENCENTLQTQMLNVDMGIFLNLENNFDNRDLGIVNCNHPFYNFYYEDYNIESCPRLYGNDNDIKKLIDRFTMDNRLFLREFWEVWDKMTLAGANEDELLLVEDRRRRRRTRRRN